MPYHQTRFALISLQRSCQAALPGALARPSRTAGYQYWIPSPSTTLSAHADSFCGVARRQAVASFSLEPQGWIRTCLKVVCARRHWPVSGQRWQRTCIRTAVSAFVSPDPGVREGAVYLEADSYGCRIAEVYVVAHFSSCALSRSIEQGLIYHWPVCKQWVVSVPPSGITILPHPSSYTSAFQSRSQSQHAPTSSIRYYSTRHHGGRSKSLGGECAREVDDRAPCRFASGVYP